MGLLLAIATILGRINAALLTLGRGLGAVCVALMVVFILMQVWFRYVMGNALPWSEEGARFLMLWMAGLMAPTAWRHGGFVGIDMLVVLLPRVLAQVLALALLGVALSVLWVAFRIGLSEVTGFSGRFATDALWVPTSLDFSTWMKVPRAWAYASMVVGAGLLIAVTVELMLRAVVTLAGAGDRLPVIAGAAKGEGAE
jgi:TRAP-type C4-dicarboxylate transport system permease small subunit